MLSESMQKALNGQLKEEMYSFYLYLAMAAYLRQRNFDGMAKWMRIQAEEEKGHALRFFDFLHDRNGKVSLGAIDQPTAEWPSVAELFAAALAHERSITKRINDLMDKANGEKDHATASFLLWFVNEQVEEEATLEPIVGRLGDIGDHVGGLYYLDHQLGKRGSE
jgi:ferritin